MNKNEFLKLCLVTNIQHNSFNDYKKILTSAIHGGVTCIQLREKNLSLNELKSYALLIQKLISPYKIPLIINDHITLAQEINANGVHLGQSDACPLYARKILGENKIIGLSIESYQELDVANQLTCINYIAASAVFQSKTKTNCRTIWGLDSLREIVNKSLHPVVAIGGIDLNNIVQVMDTGASGAAIISAIHDHPYPNVICALLLKKINERKKYVRNS